MTMLNQSTVSIETLDYNNYVKFSFKKLFLGSTGHKNQFATLKYRLSGGIARSNNCLIYIFDSY